MFYYLCKSLKKKLLFLFTYTIFSLPKLQIHTCFNLPFDFFILTSNSQSAKLLFPHLLLGNSSKNSNGKIRYTKLRYKDIVNQDIHSKKKHLNSKMRGFFMCAANVLCSLYIHFGVAVILAQLCHSFHTWGSSRENKQFFFVVVGPLRFYPPPTLMAQWSDH